MLTRKLLIFGGGAMALVVLAIVALVVIQLLRSDDPNLLTEAPPIPTATQRAVSTAAAGATATPATAAALPAGVFRFVISTGSSAKYVVTEKLSRLPVETNAVGETTTITGDLYITREGLFGSQKSSFKVDLRTLRSDESLRDNFIRMDTLRTNQYPFAEFTVESVSGFPASYAEGTEVSLTLSGSMTIHGVTKPMTFDVKARRAGDTLTAIADADFKMTDFGISPPNVPTARAHDDVHIQITIVAKQAAG